MELVKEVQRRWARFRQALEARTRLEVEMALVDHAMLTSEPTGDAEGESKLSIQERLIGQTKAHPLYKKRYVDELSGPEFTRLGNVEKPTPLDLHISKGKIQNPNKIEQVLALDCEMIETTADDMALARLSAVNLHGEQVIDLYVLPCHLDHVKDCRTWITGITTKDLREKGISFDAARRLLAMKANEDTLLIGHALEHDLSALRIQHDKVLDTALLFPVLAETGRIDHELCHGLDHLTDLVLKRSMDREKRKGVHDSIEDSMNSLDLVKHLVHLDLKKETLKPLPKRVRPSKRSRGVRYGAAASLRSFQEYSIKVAVEGGSAASKIKPLSSDVKTSRFSLEIAAASSSSNNGNRYRSAAIGKLSQKGMNFASGLQAVKNSIERKSQGKRRMDQLRQATKKQRR